MCSVGPAAKHLHRLHEALQAVTGLRLASPTRRFPRLVCRTGEDLRKRGYSREFARGSCRRAPPPASRRAACPWEKEASSGQEAVLAGPGEGGCNGVRGGRVKGPPLGVTHFANSLAWCVKVVLRGLTAFAEASQVSNDFNDGSKEGITIRAGGTIETF